MSKFIKVVAVLFAINCLVNIAYATYIGWDVALCQVEQSIAGLDGAEGAKALAKFQK
jgi:hypothetical protein